MVDCTSSFAVSVNLGRSIGRSISDDDWQSTDKRLVETWKRANDLISSRNFLYKGMKFHISTDFSPIISRLESDYRAMERLYFDKNPDSSFDPFERTDVEITFDVSHDNIIDKDLLRYGFKIVEYMLYDICLIMNLNTPSALNIWRSKIKCGNDLADINLSSNLFEISILDPTKKDWAPVGFLVLDQTVDWFYRNRGTLTLLPQSRIEKALFALLHIAKEDISINTVVWIFYALESLLDTKPGENFRYLVSRTALLCRLTSNQEKTLKKKLRDLYDVRSSFVHGGYEVIHPMHDEILDKKIEKTYVSLIEVCDNGFQIVVAGIQEIIKRDIEAPRFDEVIG